MKRKPVYCRCDHPTDLTFKLHLNPSVLNGVFTSTQVLILTSSECDSLTFVDYVKHVFIFGNRDFGVRPEIHVLILDLSCFTSVVLVELFTSTVDDKHDDRDDKNRQQEELYKCKLFHSVFLSFVWRFCCSHAANILIIP